MLSKSIAISVIPEIFSYQWRFPEGDLLTIPAKSCVMVMRNRGNRFYICSLILAYSSRLVFHGIFAREIGRLPNEVFEERKLEKNSHTKKNQAKILGWFNIETSIINFSRLIVASKCSFLTRLCCYLIFVTSGTFNII